MKIRLISILVVISASLCGQKQYMPFFGGIELGLGYSTFIDFDFESNGVMLKAIPYQIPFLPYQLGFVSAKYLNSTDYLELGIFFSKRSDSYVKKHGDGRSIPFVNLYCIDFPLKYYTDIKSKFKHPLFIYGGLIPSWLFLPETGTYQSGITSEFFRSWYLSVCSGLCYDKGMLRWKLHLSMAATGVIKPLRRSSWKNTTDYGKMVYPFEALICCAVLFR
jgi:hypothetical protein